MIQQTADIIEKYVSVTNATGASQIVLVCEHASHHIPQSLHGLDLVQEARLSHAAWDPGAMAVAEKLSAHLDAILISSDVSRLVFDCNRPPSAPDAMPSRSEVVDVPGNSALTNAQRDARADAYYWPFHRALQNAIAQKSQPIVVTIHSFTPVYHGQPRAVEIGILHDTDTRLADAMLDTAAPLTELRVERNQPYGPDHGVTHTLKEQAISHGHANVMLEIRNDLIESEVAQSAMAEMLGKWIAAACRQIRAEGGAECHV